MTASADSASAGMILELTLVGADEGSKLARAFNMGGEAEFVVGARLVDPKSQAEVSRFEVTGNSKRTSNGSVGGVDISAFDELTARALTAASEQIVEYLREN